MKALIDQLKEGAVESGLFDCHHRGLHSIVLNTRPDGSLVRIFFADHSHKMGKLYDENGHFTLGAHNHDKPIKFTHLYGNVVNVDFGNSRGAEQLYRYPFVSALETGEFGLGTPEKEHKWVSCVRPIDEVEMGTKDVHTVMVLTGEAAWLVDEGPREKVQKYIYSPHKDLSLTKDPEMYRPMSPADFKHACQRVVAGFLSPH